MQPHAPITTDLVLLGAGHAHVEVLRRFALRREPGVRLTVIGREPETPYTGMLPGLIRGDYTFEQAHIDLAPLAAAAGARLILAAAEAINLTDRQVTVTGRPEVRFDLLSIDVGGEPAMPPNGGQPVKPIGQFLTRLAALDAALARGARVAIIGGGAGGTELALAMALRYRERLRIILVCAEAEPLANAPSHARAMVRRALVDNSVELVCGVRAGSWEGGRLALSDGSFLEVATALWATGVVGPAFLAASGLACDTAGCVRVDTTLQSTSHEFVFAAGDCATMEANPRPKAGVWAVRAGAKLAGNLRRAVGGKAPRPWRPQSDALAILGLGDGKAVAWRNRIAVSGHLVWRWKDWIDRHWIRMYQRPTGFDRKPMVEARIEPDAPGDATVMLPPAGTALVQSVDHLRALIDDPYVFGEIVAAHSLSHLHAMGARPWTAMAVAAVPYASGAKMHTDLTDMLMGATRVLRADGCALAGSHSAQADALELGFAVTGLADPASALHTSGLRPGDALVLTKPLGTSIVLAGHRCGLARAAWLQAAIASMRASNGPASHVLREFGAIACAGIAGFGLAGHLLEMLRAASVGAVLYPDRIPLLPGVLDLAAQGVESPLTAQNRRRLPELASVAGTEVLFDPQTSGGLLAGIAQERAWDCVLALRGHATSADVIGVIEPGPATIRLEPEPTPPAPGIASSHPRSRG